MIAVDMNIDTDQIRKQIVIQESHWDQTLIIEQEEDTEEIDYKVYVLGPVHTKKSAKFFGLWGTQRPSGCYFQNK